MLSAVMLGILVLAIAEADHLWIANAIYTIQELRHANGDMTQAELADKLGLTRQTIIAIEKGKYSPSLEVALPVRSGALKGSVDAVRLLKDATPGRGADRRGEDGALRRDSGTRDGRPVGAPS